jgi:hypothetical protein
LDLGRGVDICRLEHFEVLIRDAYHQVLKLTEIDDGERPCLETVAAAVAAVADGIDVGSDDKLTVVCWSLMSRWPKSFAHVALSWLISVV